MVDGRHATINALLVYVGVWKWETDANVSFIVGEGEYCF